MRIIEDTRVIMLRSTGLKGIVIPIAETAEVVRKVGEVAYTLYTIYRTYPFKELVDISDDTISTKLGWPLYKVQRYRVLLEKADLLLIVRYGGAEDMVIRCFVGEEPVALHHAGLPANVNNQVALNKIRKQLNIKTTQELIQRIDEVIQYSLEN